MIGGVDGLGQVWLYLLVNRNGMRTRFPHRIAAAAAAAAVLRTVL